MAALVGTNSHVPVTAAADPYRGDALGMDRVQKQMMSGDAAGHRG
jgi:hypothetical protein